MNDKKVFFFCMTVCHHRTGEHIGKRCGVVLADTKEDAERIAWEEYMVTTLAVSFGVRKSQLAIMFSQFTKVRFRGYWHGSNLLALEDGWPLRR